MSQLQLTIVIEASGPEVWAELSDLESHVEWMADAVALEFHSDQRRGEGTAFSCATKVGPFRTTDEMVVTRWEEGQLIEVAHRGIFQGRGEFLVEPIEEKRTRIVWTEQLRFPLWLGGALGAALAGPILRKIWRGNLDRLRSRIP
jgi:hypothetical protein